MTKLSATPAAIVDKEIRSRLPFGLKKYEALYDTFDKGHDRNHLIAVRKQAIKLAFKYAPKKLVLIYIAATMHDIGLSVNREEHEKEGVKLIESDKEIAAKLSSSEYKMLIEAVGEHRSHTGDPQSVVAKIISDADRSSSSSAGVAMRRTVEYGRKNFPELDETQQLLRAGKHLMEKFGGSGYGDRYYFAETEKHQKKVFQPIVKAYTHSDVNALRKILEE